MKIIHRGRNSGKTDELIDLCRALEAEDPNNIVYIVCPNMQRANYVFRRAQESGRSIRNPISFREVTPPYSVSGSYITHVLIDDAHTCLQSIFGPVKVHAITVSTEEEL